VGGTPPTCQNRILPIEEPFVAYPADYDFHVVLRDGGIAQIRPVRADDADAVHAMFHRMGRESVYHRFFRHKDDLSAEELTYFTELDYDDRMAFVAQVGSDVVAVGRYDRLPEEPGTAEVAFTVEDGQQGRGIGSQLLKHLTNYARNNGVEAFRAFVLADNYQMMRLFRGSGYRMKRGMGEGIYEVEFPVERSEEALRVESAHEQAAVAASLLPIASHVVELRIAGCNPVSAASAGGVGDEDGDGVPDLTIRFDRPNLLSTLRGAVDNGAQPANGEVEVELWVDGARIGSSRFRTKSRTR
jgi:GNAT superfamily N-acetyltransferase